MIRTILRDKKGNSYVQTAALVLCCALILSVVFTYANLMTVIQLTKTNTEYVLDSFILHNAPQVYDAVKRGDNRIEALDAAYYVEHVEEDLVLRRQGDTLVAENSEGDTLYTITVPETEFRLDQTLDLVTTYDILVPLNFAGKPWRSLRISIRVESSYMVKQE